MNSSSLSPTGKVLKLKFSPTDIYLCCLQPNLGWEGLISDPPSRWWGHLKEVYASFSSSNKKLDPGYARKLMDIEVVLVFYPLQLSLPIILSGGNSEIGMGREAGNVVWPVLTLHTAWNDGKWDRMTQVCTISDGNAYCVVVQLVIVLTDWLEEAWIGIEVRTQVRAAAEAWLPSICFAASYLVPTHLETYLNASIFQLQKCEEKKLKGKSRWEIACWRIKSLHRMPGRPHYPPYYTIGPLLLLQGSCAVLPTKTKEHQEEIISKATVDHWPLFQILYVFG